LVKARISGEVGRENPYGFGGTIQGVSSNPPLYGKPALLSIDGLRGTRSFSARATIDHTSEPGTEDFQGHFDGFALNGFSVGQKGNLGLLLEEGRGRAEAGFRARGEEITGRMAFRGSDLRVQPQLGVTSGSAVVQRLSQHLQTSLSAVRTLGVGVGIAGTLAAPTFSVESNVGDIVAQAMKKALGAEIEQQEKELRAEFDKQTQARIQELQGLVDALRAEHLPKLSAASRLVEDLLAQAKAQATRAYPGTGKPLDSLKGLFKR
jgi:uncharacterized protein (TIGR03545 family)